MKVYDQAKLVRNSFETSNHTFINKTAAGLQSKIEEISGVQTEMGGKRTDGSKITVKLTGSITVPTSEEVDTISDSVRKEMDKLKNPSRLLQLLNDI